MLLKKLLSLLFHRVTIVGLAIAAQLVALILMIGRFGNFFPQFYLFSTILSAIVVIAIVSSNSKPGYKMTWIITIMLFPIFGGLFYLMLGNRRTDKRMQKKMEQVRLHGQETLSVSDPIVQELAKIDKHAANQARYIQDHGAFPLYRHTYSKFYPVGESVFEAMLEELRKAEHYIFMEYFIINEGIMWNSILDILVEKARQGVDVRLIYDDLGCAFRLPHKYDQKLEALGIKVAIFHPFTPTLSARQNNRDHRKITVIDGHTGFTGGINLADEYINVIERFGHWKDSGFMIKGEPVWSLTVMFLTMWEYIQGTTEDFDQFKPNQLPPPPLREPGYIQPFGDNPLDGEPVGETVYLNLINRAQDYIYIYSPYLILDIEMVTALSLAAKSGVDVRIMTPYVADKTIVHAVTRSYYPELLKSGVRIYEYVPGFMHSKAFVADDEVAVVGTINLDYRSLYLHFENGVWLYQTPSVLQVRDDFLETLKDCEEMSLDVYGNLSVYRRFKWSVLRLIAPLL
jgi:cardiolipin synthase